MFPQLATYPLGVNVALFALAAGIVWFAGTRLSRYAKVIAEKTGAGQALIGTLLLGGVVSLPEVSTTIAAARLRQYEMAFADAFGTNLFSVMLIFVADAFYPGGPVLNEVGRFSLFAILLGIAVSTVYLTGLIERRNYALLRMGVDSLLVLGICLGGLVILFHLR